MDLPTIRGSIFKSKFLKIPLCPGVNFTNILPAAFMLVEPKGIKKIDSLSVYFMLSGFAHVKAVHRTLMKLSPDFSYGMWLIAVKVF